MRLLVFLLIVLAGCQSQDSTEASLRDSLQREQEAIARQKEELQKENQALRALNEKRDAEEQARKAEEEARKAEENKVYPSDAVLGSWKVRITCKESDCPNSFTVGDVFTQDWTIDLVRGQHVITVTSNLKNTNKEYYGSFDGKYLRAGFEAQTTEWVTRTTAKVNLRLRMKDENTLVGTRRVVNADPCSIVYDIQAVRD